MINNKETAEVYKILSECYKKLHILETSQKVFFAKDANYGDSQFSIDETDENFEKIIEIMKNKILLEVKKTNE